MSKGWDNKLTELLGEHLTASYLTRRGLVVSFTPKNMPRVDLLATNESLRTLPIQQKTVRSGTAQMNALDFLDIEWQPVGQKKRQVIRGKRRLADSKMPYVFLFLGNGQKDEFFICLASDVQILIHDIYSTWLRKVKGIRPKNPESTHCGLTKRDLAKFEDNWDAILNHPVLRGR